MEEILNKIKNNYTNDPYPHMTIDDFLPKELLLNINKEWNGKYIKRVFEHSFHNTIFGNFSTLG